MFVQFGEHKHGDKHVSNSVASNARLPLLIHAPKPPRKKTNGTIRFISSDSELFAILHRKCLFGTKSPSVLRKGGKKMMPEVVV